MITDIQLCGKYEIEHSVKGIKQLEDILPQLEEISRIICNAKGKIFMCGIGKSYHIGCKISATLKSIGASSFALHATEAMHGDAGAIRCDDIIIFLSDSGETKEIIHLAKYIKDKISCITSITSNARSTLARISDHAIILPNTKPRDQIKAPTASTTLTLVAGDIIAMMIAKINQLTNEEFQSFHPAGSLGASLSKISDIMKKDMPLIDQEGKISDAILKMTSHRLGCVGITDDSEKLCGIITDGDLRRHMKDADLLNKNASDIMTKNPITSHQEKNAAEVLQLMNEEKISSIFIVDDENHPLGVVHLHDLIALGVRE